MAKPQRMAAMTLGLIIAALATPLALEGPILGLTLVLVLLGTLVTAVRRTRAILDGLEAR
jgi:mannose/fructose/N-acetylgalactosamine-specific phosphotransferase system component IID